MAASNGPNCDCQTGSGHMIAVEVLGEIPGNGVSKVSRRFRRRFPRTFAAKIRGEVACDDFVGWSR